MILLTGATGTVGSALLRRLTTRSEPVRCLVRDPRRLGDQRVRVQIALGDLGQLASFRNAYFYVSNPFDRSVRVTLEAALPSLLTERGWGLRYTSGAASFTLGPRAVREVRFELTEGADFTADEVRNRGQNVCEIYSVQPARDSPARHREFEDNAPAA